MKWLDAASRSSVFGFPRWRTALSIEMLIYQATKRVSQYVLKDEKEFVEQLKAQYELQCEKDNTDDKKSC